MCYGFGIYLVNIKNIRRIAHIFVRLLRKAELYIVYEYPLASEACQFRLVLWNCTSTRCSCSALRKVNVCKLRGELF